MQLITGKNQWYRHLCGAKRGRLHAVRAHWSIENTFHWTLDVTFREYDARLRTGGSAETFPSYTTSLSICSSAILPKSP
jgi:predicted transposase YbfD/YdcC